MAKKVDRAVSGRCYSENKEIPTVHVDEEEIPTVRVCEEEEVPTIHVANPSPRPRRIPDGGLDLKAKRFVRGVLPQKVSDLENDIGFITEKEAEEVFLNSGEGLLTLFKKANNRELKEISNILDRFESVEQDQDHLVEEVPEEDIKW